MWITRQEMKTHRSERMTALPSFRCSKFSLFYYHSKDQVIITQIYDGSLSLTGKY